MDQGARRYGRRSRVSHGGSLLLAVLATLLLCTPNAAADNSAGTPCDYTTRAADLDIPDGTVGGPFGTSATSSLWTAPPQTFPDDSITDVNIRVEIQHPSDADLDISVSHAGRTVSLSTDNGGNGGNYTGTTFDDQGANGTIVGKSAPFTGSFVPEQLLSAFDGLPARGVWTIRVSDDTGTAVGGPGDPPPPPQKLISWSVDYRAANCPFDLPPCDEHGNNFDSSLPSANGSQTSLAGTKGTGSVSDVDVYVRSIAGGGGTFTASFGRSTATERILVTGAAPNFVNTVFDDQATQAFPFASPNTGRFLPQEALNSALFGNVTAQWRFTLARSGGTTSGSYRWGHRVMVSGDGCTDPDADVIWTTSDNCPSNSNVDQANYEGDTEGDICDADDDNDTRADTADACPRGLRPSDPGGTAPDYDSDGCRDPEDADDDSDGVPDTSDRCAQASRGVGGDTDGDGCKDFEETDDDNDGVPDAGDNCPLNANSTQTDTDRDGAGDACDPDDDGDGVIDSADAFPLDRTRSKPPATAATPMAAPVLSSLKLSSKSFAAAAKGASIAAKRKRKKPPLGTTITYRADIASATTFTVRRVTTGVRKGKSCVRRAKGRKGRSCTLLVASGTFSRRDKAGGVKLKFTGRVRSGTKTKALTPGRYVLDVQGRNARGAGKAVRAKFAIRSAARRR